MDLQVLQNERWSSVRVAAIVLGFVAASNAGAGAEEKESPSELLVGEWDGTVDSDNRILATFNPDGTFEMVNVDPATPQRIKVRVTGSFKTDFNVSPHHLDLYANIYKPKHLEPVKHTFELIVQMESKDSFRMSNLGSDVRPKVFDKKSVVMRRATPNLSTPTVAIQFYKTAVAARDWKMAQECLSSDLHKTLKDAIADRSFFDQYLDDDFDNKTLELIPVRNTTSEDIDELRRDNRLRPPEAKRFTAQVGHGGEDVPWVTECTFVREKHGWKLTTDQIKSEEDFSAWYRKSIAEPDQGKARDREKTNDKLQIALVLNARGRLEQTGAIMKLAVQNNSEEAINVSSLMQSSVLILNGQEFRLHTAFHDQWKNTRAITSGGSVEVTLPTAWYGIGSDFVASHYPEHEIEWRNKLYLGKHAVALRVEGGISNVTQFEMSPDG